jgi:chemotaxis protein MotB
VRVPGDVLFSPGKIELKSTAKRTLDQIAQAIRGNHAGKMIRVEGYTDTDPIRKSPWTDNLELSLQRSAAVARYLQSKGVDGKRMYASGFGENKPRSSKANSRRVEIVVLAERS